MIDTSAALRPIELCFDGGHENRFYGSSGCNRIFGTYVVQGDHRQGSIKFDGQVGMTRMACLREEGEPDVEGQYMAALQRVQNVHLTPTRQVLVLSGSSTDDNSKDAVLLYTRSNEAPR